MAKFGVSFSWALPYRCVNILLSSSPNRHSSLGSPPQFLPQKTALTQPLMRLLPPNTLQPRRIPTVEVEDIKNSQAAIAWIEPHRKRVEDVAFTSLQLSHTPETYGVEEGVVRD